MKKKLVGGGTIIILLCGFVAHTQYKYRIYNGTNQYSAFGGWQLAANALYGYAHAPLDLPEAVPSKFQILHRIVNRHMDSIRYLKERPDEEVAIYYLWDEKSPLIEYLNYKWKGDSTTGYFRRWGTMGPLYGSYGRYLIRQHPIFFIRYYVWPNLIKYYSPPTKFMGFYNLGMKTTAPIAAEWFGWKNGKITTYFKDTRIRVTEFFPVLFAVINLVFILSFIALLSFGGFRGEVICNRNVLLCALAIWICNLGFSVLSAPIELRYQIFPMIISFVFAILFIKSLLIFPISRSKALFKNNMRCIL